MIPQPKQELKPFEREIIRLWLEGKPEQPWTWSHSAVSPKAHWIRGYLQEKGEAFVKELFEGYRDFCQKARKYGVKIKPSTYQQMKESVWLLKRLGLIIVSRKEKSVRKGHFKRTYYRLNPEFIDSPDWEHPRQALYPSSDWRRIPPERKAEIRQKMKEKRRKTNLISLNFK